MTDTVSEMLEPAGGHPSRLEWLAWWLDSTDPILEELAGEEVGRGAQADLRRWARELRERVARTEPNPAETQPRPRWFRGSDWVAEDRSVLAEINRSLRSQLEEVERQLDELRAYKEKAEAEIIFWQDQLADAERERDEFQRLFSMEVVAREAVQQERSLAGTRIRELEAQDGERLREALERVERALAPVRGGPIALTRVKLIVHDALHPRFG